MANPLIDLSAALADLVKGAEGFVVRVEAGRRMPSTGILWNREGVVVTAAHTVRREEEIAVTMPDGNEVEAALAGRDGGTDLAVLRLGPKVQEAAGPAGPGEEAAGPGWEGPRFAAGDTVRVGHLVFALGRPGRSLRATGGIVSAFGESWRTPSGGTVDFYLETDASLPAGFSGGPLLNAAGEVLGMNTSTVPRGVGTTIPVSTIQRIADSILSHGRVRRAYLGVNTYPVPLPEVVRREEDQPAGLLVTEVEAGSPADQAGLYLGDVLLAIDGAALQDLEDLMAALSEDRAGRSVTIRLLRGGKRREMKVTLGERV
jgi:S1-C subfamily serine protease